MNVRKLGRATKYALPLAPLALAAQTVVYFKFDGPVGSPVTTIADSGPEGIDGRAVGATTYSNGVLGASLNVSGDGNYASIPHSPNLVLTNDFTVELFFKANEPLTTYGSDPADVINKLHTASVGTFLSSFAIEYAAHGSLTAFVSYAPNVGLFVGPTAANFQDGRWHQVALVFRHHSPLGTNSLQLFVDYTLQGASTGSAAPVAWANFPIYIGAGNYPAGQDNGPFRRNFDGQIDEVRISNQALLPDAFVAIPPIRFVGVAISKSIDGIQLRWNSATNHAYQVQSTPQLPASSWGNLGGAFPGVGNPLTLPDAFVPGQTQRFFRVLESP